MGENTVYYLGKIRDRLDSTNRKFCRHRRRTWRAAYDDAEKFAKRIGVYDSQRYSLEVEKIN